MSIHLKLGKEISLKGFRKRSGQGFDMETAAVRNSRVAAGEALAPGITSWGRASTGLQWGVVADRSERTSKKTFMGPDVA